MKRLGVLEDDDLSSDDTFLRYIDLFKGPLTGPTMQALTALCGLDSAAMAANLHA
jgi:hypothetical protein